MSDPLFGVFALLAGGAAIGAGVAWRGERTRRGASESELAALRETLASERRSAEANSEAKRGRDAELAELRQRLDKAKRRAFAAQEEKAPLEARVAALEAELADREREAKRLRDEVARLEGEVESAVRERTRLREELARASGERDAAARVHVVDPESHRELAQRFAAAEDEVRRLGAQLREQEREALRYRQRERTHRRLYMVIRGELEAAKDRIRTLTGAPPGEAFAEPDDAGEGAERES